MPTFLHTADWQIGRQYSQFPADDAVALAEARLAAVETIARLAVEHKVDAVPVAGDVFDAQTVVDRTIRKLFNALQGFPEPWIMIPGNHNAALTESVWTRASRLGAVPANLHLALQGMVLDFSALGFSALTAPLTQRHTYNDLTEWFDEDMHRSGGLPSVPAGGCGKAAPRDIERYPSVAAGRGGSQLGTSLVGAPARGLSSPCPGTPSAEQLLALCLAQAPP